MNNDWKESISGAFGQMDLKFAQHPTDRARAAKMLADAIQGEIGFSDYCKSIEKWLRNQLAQKGADGAIADEHVNEQMKFVRNLRSYFAVD